jgi:hypothetical protein
LCIPPEDGQQGPKHVAAQIPYILESNPHLVFATFLNEKR